MRTMKKIVFLVFFALLSIANAQGIYTKVTKYDKFDDVEWEKNIKTLITQTDSTIVIETKGSQPTTYVYSDNEIFSKHFGDKSKMKNLVANVWGYESQYLVFTEEFVNNAKKEMENQLKDLPDSLRTNERVKFKLAEIFLKNIDKLPSITFRTISYSQYLFDYDTDMVWVKFEDGSRIIYTKN